MKKKKIQYEWERHPEKDWAFVVRNTQNCCQQLHNLSYFQNGNMIVHNRPVEVNDEHIQTIGTYMVCLLKTKRWKWIYFSKIQCCVLKPFKTGVTRKKCCIFLSASQQKIRTSPRQNDWTIQTRISLSLATCRELVKCKAVQEVAVSGEESLANCRH